MPWPGSSSIARNCAGKSEGSEDFARMVSARSFFTEARSTSCSSFSDGSSTKRSQDAAALTYTNDRTRKKSNLAKAFMGLRVAALRLGS